MASIEEFDAHSPAARVDSPASLEAMRRLGLELSDLLYASKTEFAESILQPERLDQRFAAFEQRRLQRIEDVKVLRKKIKSTRALPLVKLANSARTNGSSLTPSRLKPLEEREKHYLELLRTKQEAHLLQVAEAERYRQLHLTHQELSTQAQSERERLRQKEEYEKARELAGIRQEHKSVVAEAHRTHQNLAYLQSKKDQLQAQLSQLRAVSYSDSIREVATAQLQELARKVEAQRKHLLHKKATRTESRFRSCEGTSRILAARANLERLLSSDASAVRLSRHTQHVAELDRQRELAKRAKEHLQQKREARMQQHTEDCTKQLIQKKDGIALKDEFIRERVEQARRKRENHIKTLSEKARQRHAQSEMLRHQQNEQLQFKLREVDAGVKEALLKAERSLTLREEASRRRRELNALHRTDTLKNVQRIRKAESYQQRVALTRIQEDRTARMLQQEAKNAQVRQVQMLHKQLLSERHRMARDFDRILSKKGPSFLYDERVCELLNKSAESITLPVLTPKKTPKPDSEESRQEPATILA